MHMKRQLTFVVFIIAIVFAIAGIVIDVAARRLVLFIYLYKAICLVRFYFYGAG